MMIDWRRDVAGGQKREYSGYTWFLHPYDGRQLVTTPPAHAPKAAALVRQPARAGADPARRQ